MSALLERTVSSYYPAFNRMLEDLKLGLEEAQDINLYLKPLGRMLERFEEMDYFELPKRFPSLFHVVALVWANSIHYQHPVKMVVLIQEISNMIIEMVSY